MNSFLFIEDFLNYILTLQINNPNFLSPCMPVDAKRTSGRRER